MVKMSTSGHVSDDSEDDVSSCESSADESSDDSCDSASVKSLAFTVRPRHSKVTVKSKKSNKRVRFKAGDNLVLIYIIPNREMLGLKSESEDSDEYDGSDDDSDDNDDSGDDEDDNTDDDDDDDGEEDESGKTKPNVKKAKPFAKLISVKQVNKRKSPEVKNTNKTVNDKPKETTSSVSNVSQLKTKKSPRIRPKKEKREIIKPVKMKDYSNDIKNKSKSKQYKTNNAIKVDRRPRSRRNRSRLLEIRATVESTNKTYVPPVAPKLSLKPDVKPSIIDVNNSVSSKQLTNRTRLQPTSFRITKPGSRPSSAGVSKSVSSIPEKQTPMSHVVSSNYSSITSVLPDSYMRFQSLQNNTVEETIKRLDPDNMNSSGKRNYAWQIANGTITSQSLRTPSILPFWDSLQNSVTENNTIKLPT